ncbi:MAG: UDP-glucose 4-epimerase GalE [Lachnospiraceae bacterium]|nr:UDP-glucose 4-epimerase GalE [Lachnospiraceae bacterium]
MKILVTGGAGYIGSHTVVELIERGHEPVIVDNMYNAFEEVYDRIEKITGVRPVNYKTDIRDKAGLEEIFSKEQPEAVIHFAGLKAVGESVREPLNYYENNVGGSVILFEVMQAAGCRNIVFSSSATVYGMNNPIPYREDFQTGPCTNPYGSTKLTVETILKDVYASDNSWNVILLRYFNPIGAHESGLIGEDPIGIPNNLVPYIARVAVGKLPFLNVFGDDYDTPDGTGVRDYIHVTDLAKGHICAVEMLKDNPGLKIYNLGTGNGLSVLDVVKAFERACGKEIPYKVVPRRAGDLPSYYADASLALKEMGWKAELDLDRMCADTWRWQSQNPDGYRK